MDHVGNLVKNTTSITCDELETDSVFPVCVLFIFLVFLLYVFHNCFVYFVMRKTVVDFFFGNLLRQNISDCKLHSFNKLNAVGMIFCYFSHSVAISCFVFVIHICSTHYWKNGNSEWNTFTDPGDTRQTYDFISISCYISYICVFTSVLFF